MSAVTPLGSVLMAEDVRVIDAAFSNAWPPIATTYLDGWQLRHSPGDSNRRINSVLTLFSGLSSNRDNHIKMVEQFYWGRSLPSRFMVSPASMPKGLDQDLEGLGYFIDGPTWVQGANLEDVLPSYNPIDGKVFIGKPTNNWMAVYMEGIEGQHNISSKVDLINRIANDHVLAQISDHSGLVAVGLCVCEGEWSGIFCMHTLNSHRRQGYASQILSALTDWARVKGAKQMYLQVEQENSAAQKFYQASGFKIQYGYQYRVRENITCE